MRSGLSTETANAENDIVLPGAPGVVMQRVVVPLPVDDLWALWRDLSEQARVLEDTAAIFRAQGVERRTAGQSWATHIKTAIQREGKARRLRDRAKQYKALYWQERHNSVLGEPCKKP